MATEKVKLLGYVFSPFSRRVEWALKLKGIDYEYVEEDIFNKSPLLLQLNPVRKKVPVLVHGNEVVSESFTILEYIDETWKQNPLLPQDPYARAISRFWANFTEEKVLDAGHTALIWSTGEQQEKALKSTIEALEHIEGDLMGKKILGGESIGYLDIAMGWISYWLPIWEEVGSRQVLDPSKFPAIISWINKILSHPVIKDNLPPRDKAVAYFHGRRKFHTSGKTYWNSTRPKQRSKKALSVTMASCPTAFFCNHAATAAPWSSSRTGTRRSFCRRSSVKATINAKLNQKTSLQYKKLGDSDLVISEITLGTMTFGQQNTEKEAHEILSYAFENGINALDTAEAYPIPMKKETQGSTDRFISSWLKSQPRDKVILATKIAGYSEMASYLRDNATVLRVDAANIKESVEKSLKRLGTDYIDLIQIHWPDRYVPLFGAYSYDFSKWRPSVPFVEQLKAFQELIDEGKVRYIGVSNETSYGVMEFVHAAKVEGLPKIVSIQNSYSLLVRTHFEIDLVEVCHPKNYNIGLLAYSPLGGGSLTGKYIDLNSEAAKKGRLNLFPGYMERYNKSIAREATIKYIETAKKHGLTPVQLALGFVRDRPFVTSSIVGATSVNQLKEDIDAFLLTERPLPPEVVADIEDIFKRYKDPTIF